MEVTCITVDCANPAAVAEFWNEALGWGGVAADSEGMGAICGPPGGGLYLEFIRVPEAKQVKNRVHVGCSAGALELLDAEIDRLIALGATIAWEEEFSPAVAASYRNVVMCDIEGNEFCLSGGSFE
jgi:glyoxalase superfamily protein